MRCPFLIGMVLLSSCAASPIGEDTTQLAANSRAPGPTQPIVPPRRAAPTEPIPTPPVPVPPPELAPPSITALPEIASLSASELLAAADQAVMDARGYVAWKKSKPANINALTPLTAALILAASNMRAGKVDHMYQAADVINLRAALGNLRTFLLTKGD